MPSGVPDQLYTLYFGVHRKAAMLACDRCGVFPSDMLYVSTKHFRQSSKDSEEQVYIRYTMHERHRQFMFKKLLEEKNKLIYDPQLSLKWKERNETLLDAAKPPTISKKSIRKATKALNKEVESSLIMSNQGNAAGRSASNIDIYSFPSPPFSQGDSIAAASHTLVAPPIPVEGGEEHARHLVPFAGASTEVKEIGSSPLLETKSLPFHASGTKDDREEALRNNLETREKMQSGNSHQSLEENTTLSVEKNKKVKWGGEKVFPDVNSLGGSGLLQKKELENVVRKVGSDASYQAKLAAIWGTSTTSEGVGQSTFVSSTSPYYRSVAGIDDSFQVLFSSPFTKAQQSTTTTPAAAGSSAIVATEENMETEKSVFDGKNGNEMLLEEDQIVEVNKAAKQRQEEVLNLLTPKAIPGVETLDDSAGLIPNKRIPHKPPVPSPAKGRRTFKSLKGEVEDLKKTRLQMIKSTLPLARENVLLSRNEEKRSASPVQLVERGEVHANPQGRAFLYPPHARSPHFMNEKLVADKSLPALLPVLSPVHLASTLSGNGSAIAEAKKTIAGEKQESLSMSKETDDEAKSSERSIVKNEIGVDLENVVSSSTLPLQTSQEVIRNPFSSIKEDDRRASSSNGKSVMTPLVYSKVSKQNEIARKDNQPDESSSKQEQSKKKTVPITEKQNFEHLSSHEKQIDIIKRVAILEAKCAEKSFNEGRRNMQQEVPVLGSISHRVRAWEENRNSSGLEKGQRLARNATQKKHASAREQLNKREKRIVEKLNRGALLAEHRREGMQQERKEVNENRALLFKEQLKFVSRQKEFEMRLKLAKLEKRHVKAEVFNYQKFKGMASHKRFEHDQEGVFRRTLKNELQTMSKTKKWELEKIKNINM